MLNAKKLAFNIPNTKKLPTLDVPNAPISKNLAWDTMMFNKWLGMNKCAIIFWHYFIQLFSLFL